MNFQLSKFSILDEESSTQIYVSGSSSLWLQPRLEFPIQNEIIRDIS